MWVRDILKFETNATVMVKLRHLIACGLQQRSQRALAFACAAPQLGRAAVTPSASSKAVGDFFHKRNAVQKTLGGMTTGKGSLLHDRGHRARSCRVSPCVFVSSCDAAQSAGLVSEQLKTQGLAFEGA